MVDVMGYGLHIANPLLHHYKLCHFFFRNNNETIYPSPTKNPFDTDVPLGRKEILCLRTLDVDVVANNTHIINTWS